VQDAQAAVRLYTMFRKEWELDIKNKLLKRRTDDKPTTDSENVSLLTNLSSSTTKAPTTTVTKTSVAKKKPSVKPTTRPLYTDSD